MEPRSARWSGPPADHPAGRAEEVVAALRRAVARVGREGMSQPSRLRTALRAELGPDADRHRSQVHQLVVAAEERVPAAVVDLVGDAQGLEELARSLAAARGWTPEVAREAVRTWATALADRPGARAAEGLLPTDTGGVPPTVLPGAPGSTGQVRPPSRPALRDRQPW